MRLRKLSFGAGETAGIGATVVSANGESDDADCPIVSAQPMIPPEIRRISKMSAMVRLLFERWELRLVDICRFLVDIQLLRRVLDADPLEIANLS